MAATVEYFLPSTDILRRGPHILVNIDGEDGLALLDTGASRSYIDIAMARFMQFAEDETTHRVTGATGQGTYPRFRANLYIPALELTIRSPIPGLPLRAQRLPWVAIIGRDVLCQYEFTINGETGLIRFSRG